MTSKRDVACEISSSDPVLVSCQLPDSSWIETVAGLGSALGTLVASAAAIFGVYEAFKQRARADKLEKKETLRAIGESYFQSMNALADATVKGKYRAAGAAHRALFDLTNVLNDGDRYQKRLAEALSIVTGPVVDDVMDALRPAEEGVALDEVRARVNLLGARSVAETVTEQAQSAFNVVLNVDSEKAKEQRIAFFERRATSVAAQISKRLEKDKEKK